MIYNLICQPQDKIDDQYSTESKPARHESELKVFSEQYLSLFRRYIINPQEQFLAETFELGNRMAMAEIPPADIAEIHERALDSVINEWPNLSIKEVIQLASKPFMELHIAYSMAYQRELEHRRRYQNELKNQQEMLRNSYEMLAKAQKIAQIGSGEWHLETNQVTCSDEMYRILGLDAGDISQLLEWEALSHLIHPDDFEWVRRTGLQMREKRQPISMEFRIRRPDGTLRTVNCEVDIIFHDNGKPIKIIGTIQDITERKQTEDALATYSDHLECLVEEQTRELLASQEKLIQSERLAVLGQLSGSIAHEIRNPLGVINGSVYYLKMKLSEADEKTRVHLDRIQNQVTISTAIIQSLLDLTRMTEPKKIRVDLADILETVLSKVSKRVSVIKNLPRGEFWVEADERQLLILFKNIVTNAEQAMDQPGTLEVRVEKPKEGWLEVSLKDSGEGILPENLAKIFQPFFSTKTSGFGFGLTICQMIIKKHEGTIQVQSEAGKGTHFIIGLPALGAKKTGGYACH